MFLFLPCPPPDFSQMARLSANILQNANIAAKYSYWLRNKSHRRVRSAAVLIVAHDLRQQMEVAQFRNNMCVGGRPASPGAAETVVSKGSLQPSCLLTTNSLDI